MRLMLIILPVGVPKVCDGADDNEARQTWTG